MILSVAQDLVYCCSAGKEWTPKRIGLGSTLHQMTRSRQLVSLFNKAVHTISYKDVLRIDTSLGEETLRSMNYENGAVIPLNLMHGKFVHFSADNIDINDDWMVKNTFHATQMAAWQRGPARDVILDDVKPSTSQVLHVPEAMERLSEVNIPSSEISPLFSKPIEV